MTATNPSMLDDLVGGARPRFSGNGLAYEVRPDVVVIDTNLTAAYDADANSVTLEASNAIDPTAVVVSTGAGRRVKRFYQTGFEGATPISIAIGANDGGDIVEIPTGLGDTLNVQLIADGAIEGDELTLYVHFAAGMTINIYRGVSPLLHTDTMALECWRTYRFYRTVSQWEYRAPNSNPQEVVVEQAAGRRVGRLTPVSAAGEYATYSKAPGSDLYGSALDITCTVSTYLRLLAAGAVNGDDLTVRVACTGTGVTYEVRNEAAAVLATCGEAETWTFDFKYKTSGGWTLWRKAQLI